MAIRPPVCATQDVHRCMVEYRKKTHYALFLGKRCKLSGFPRMLLICSCFSLPKCIVVRSGAPRASLVNCCAGRWEPVKRTWNKSSAHTGFMPRKPLDGLTEVCNRSPFSPSPVFINIMSSGDSRIRSKSCYTTIKETRVRMHGFSRHLPRVDFMAA